VQKTTNFVKKKISFNFMLWIFNFKQMPTILAIESSCDETSAAVIQHGVVLSNVVATQKVHEKYGGVVPELASRAHQQHIIPVVAQGLQEAKITKSQLQAIAFTRGPGLLGALLVGTSFAKSLALGLDIPLIDVNHMQAHILAHFIEEPKPKFPFICLTVSGGHTQLVLVKSHLQMEIIGETLDDAVGEAFDKTAKILGLPYPGGQEIDKRAKEGNPTAFKFAEVSMEGLNYSFSGIKTSFLYFLQARVKENPNFITENMNDICASMQYTLIQILLAKLKRAAKLHNINEIAIAGGVSANSGLRKTLVEIAEKNRWKVYIPAFQYCTDNAAMIAIAAHYKYLAGEFCPQTVSPMPRMGF
jgi:N6-L-threonylcarbamoyladenine synthase